MADTNKTNAKRRARTILAGGFLTTDDLRESTGYDPDKDGSVDDLIGFKDGVEDEYERALEFIEAVRTSGVLDPA